MYIVRSPLPAAPVDRVKEDQKRLFDNAQIKKNYSRESAVAAPAICLIKVMRYSRWRRMRRGSTVMGIKCSSLAMQRLIAGVTQAHRRKLLNRIAVRGAGTCVCLKSNALDV